MQRININWKTFWRSGIIFFCHFYRQPFFNILPKIKNVGHPLVAPVVGSWSAELLSCYKLMLNKCNIIQVLEIWFLGSALLSFYYRRAHILNLYILPIVLVPDQLRIMGVLSCHLIVSCSWVFQQVSLRWMEVQSSHGCWGKP